MTILQQIASAHGRRDDVPNGQLARRPAESRDGAGLHEPAENPGKERLLWADLRAGRGLAGEARVSR